MLALPAPGIKNIGKGALGVRNSSRLGERHPWSTSDRSRAHATQPLAERRRRTNPKETKS